jgi:hypothetical protein
MVKEGFGGRIYETHEPFAVENNDAVRVFIYKIAEA